MYSQDITQVPLCNETTNINFIIGSYFPTTQFQSIIINKGTFINNELYFTNTINVQTKKYSTNEINTYSGTSSYKKNDYYGFNVVIPEFNSILPIFNIPNWPTINDGCNTCINKNWPIKCKQQAKIIKQCKTSFGKTICVNKIYSAPISCLNEISFNPKIFPSINFFSFKKTEIQFSYQIIPNTNIDSTFSLGISTSLANNVDTQIHAGTPIISFTVDTCKIELKLKIQNLKLTYDDVGININNLIITLFEETDIFPLEKKLISKTDSQKNIQLWYPLKLLSFTLYDILNVNVNKVENVPIINNIENIPTSGNLLEYILSLSNPSATIINFLKQTVMNINCGLLICPFPTSIAEEYGFLKFVTMTQTMLYPYKNLNKIQIPDIPSVYKNVPQIPNNTSNKIIQKINTEINNITNIPLSIANKEIIDITQKVKEIENVNLNITSMLSNNLILKTPYKSSGVDGVA